MKVMTFAVALEAVGLENLLETSRKDSFRLLKDNAGCVLIYTFFHLREPRLSLS